MRAYPGSWLLFGGAGTDGKVGSDGASAGALRGLGNTGAMTVRVHVEPSLLEWASARSGKSPDDLSRRVPRLAAWARGDAQPTLKQLETFARATSTPVGLLMLPEPPDMPLPVPDFRTLPNAVAAPATPDLLDTIYLCEERQEWYRSYALVNNADPLDFVGSATAEDDVVSTANHMRARLDFGLASRHGYSSGAARSIGAPAERVRPKQTAR